MYSPPLIRCLAATFTVVVSGLAVNGSAGAVPKPPSKFWTIARCENVLRGTDYPLRTADGHVFHVGLVTCVGAGGPTACKWTSGHGSRLYSRFTVYARARYVGGIVRLFWIATRAGRGYVKITRDAGDQYVGWPADFYFSPSSVRIVAPTSTAARFRTIAALAAAHQVQEENTADCTYG